MLVPHILSCKRPSHETRLNLALGQKNIMTNIEEIISALEVSSLIYAAEVLSKIQNEHWKFTRSFGESTATFEELHNTYTIRSRGLSSRKSKHAMQLYKSTIEFLKHLDSNLNRTCYINCLSGNEEYQYLLFVDPIDKQIMGILKAYSQFDVSDERWQEIWE